MKILNCYLFPHSIEVSGELFIMKTLLHITVSQQKKCHSDGMSIGARVRLLSQVT